MKWLLKDGSSKRLAVAAQLIKDEDWVLEGFHFAFGENDLYCIADLPDTVSIIAISLAVGASGGGQVNPTVLLTPGKMD